MERFLICSVDTGVYLSTPKDGWQGLSLCDHAGDDAVWIKSSNKVRGVTGSKQTLRFQRQSDREFLNDFYVKLQHTSGTWLSVDGGEVELNRLDEKEPGVFLLVPGPMRLPSQYVAEMRENGYTVLEEVLPAATAKTLKQEFARQAEEGTRDHRTTQFRITKALSTTSPEVKVGSIRAAMHPVALWIIKQYLGKDGQEEDIVLSHPPSVNVIPPVERIESTHERARPPDWHSDYPFKGTHFPELEWPKDLRLAVQYNICVDEFRADNAATQFVPGSHTSGRFPPPSLNHINSDLNGMMAMAAATATQQFTAPAGAAVLYDSRMWHRACPELNVSGDYRAALLNAVTVSWVEAARADDRQKEIRALRQDSVAMKALSQRELRLLDHLYCRGPTPQPEGALGAVKVKVVAKPFTSVARDQVYIGPCPVEDVVGDSADISGPMLVCFHPSGFMPAHGAQALEDLVKGAKEAGITDHVMLSYPETYGFKSPGGTDEWPKYLDALVQEIDGSPRRAGRPVILWGFQAGCTAMMSLAKRLAERVLKLYVTCFSMGDYPLQPAVLDALRDQLCGGPVKVFRNIYYSNPTAPIIKATFEGCETEEKLAETIAASTALTDLVELARRQFLNMIYPDVDRDFCKLSAPIHACFASQDQISSDHHDFWKTWTSGSCKVEILSGTPIGLLPRPRVKKGDRTVPRCELFNRVCEDMARCVASSKTALAERARGG